MEGLGPVITRIKPYVCVCVCVCVCARESVCICSRYFRAGCRAAGGVFGRPADTVFGHMITVK